MADAAAAPADAAAPAPAAAPAADPPPEDTLQSRIMHVLLDEGVSPQDLKTAGYPQHIVASYAALFPLEWLIEVIQDLDMKEENTYVPDSMRALWRRSQAYALREVVQVRSLLLTRGRPRRKEQVYCITNGVGGLQAGFEEIRNGRKKTHFVDIIKRDDATEGNVTLGPVDEGCPVQ